MAKKRRRKTPRTDSTTATRPPLPAAPAESVGRRVAGAIAAYRGVRRQALYALLRLLQLQAYEELHPEGIEDLSLTGDGALLEACQVKGIEAALALSHLDLRGEDSFFQAAARRARAGGTEKLVVVSFGPVGPELAAFSARDEAARSSLLQKLQAAGIEDYVAANILARLEIREVSEGAIRSEVVQKLGDLLTGIDPESAFDLLSFWIYLRSEERARLSIADARQRIVAVGSFLADMAAHRAEWYVSVVPVDEPTLPDERRRELEQEFFQGVSVRYEHVAAGLAVDRPARILEVEEGFEEKRVVVLHAASGQGKTTLAYLFMRALPEHWRFRIPLVEDRSHALRMARALMGHAEAIGLPVYVHVDVGPRDLDWPTLVRELATNPKMRVLVTLREEDWRRSSDTSAFELVDVDPTFSENEAREIYAGLHARFPDAPATFEEAWARFGEGGPLLEFVHLVTQRQELRERLSDQVRRVREESIASGQPARIDFLRRVAVASASGARLRLADVVQDVGLGDPAHVVFGLEREYLVRLSDDRTLIGGLHPVRSDILQDLLTDETFSTWPDEVVRVLPLIADNDLEVFLLHVLEGHPNQQARFVAAACMLQPTSWIGFAGVGRALRWRGIADYADSIRELIDEIDPNHSGRWSVMLDPDIADAMPGSIDEIWETMARVDERGRRAADASRAFRARQPPKADAFRLLDQWLREGILPGLPQTAADWTAFGEMAFFAARLSVDWDLPWLLPEALDHATHEIPVESLAALSMGLAIAPEIEAAWRQRNRAELVERYRHEVDGVAYSDDGADVSVDFLYPVADGTHRESVRRNSPGDTSNAEAVRRIDLLRRLLPDREHYGSQGWGHRVPGVPHDGTTKRIPQRSLPPLWLTAQNSTLRGVVERWWRAPTWSAFRSSALERRESVCSHLERLTASLVRYHRRQHGQVLGEDLQEAWFQEWSAELDEHALLPLPAVDRYGLLDESAAQVDPAASHVVARGLALVPYAPYLKARRDVLRPLSNFATQAASALAVAGSLGRAAPGERDALRARLVDAGLNVDLVRLSALNLRDALQALAPFQLESRRTFPSSDLGGLERRERRAFLRAAAAWMTLVQTPSLRVEDVADEGLRRLSRCSSNWQNELWETLLAVREGVSWAISIDDETGHIMLQADGVDAVEVYSAIEPAINATHAVLEKLPEDHRLWTVARWPRIIVVPQVRGRPLASEGVELSTLVVSGAEWTPQWWHFVPRELPETLRLNQETSPWAVDDLEFGNAVSTSLLMLWALVIHLLDLPDDESLDELGRAISEAHLSALSPTPLELWRAAQEHAEEMVACVRRQQLASEAGARLLELLSAVNDVLARAPGWPAGREPRVDEIEAWAPSLEAVLGLGAEVRLAWATIVLEHQASGST